MQKVDAGTFDVDKCIRKYLIIEDTCSKAKLTVRKILAYSRLWPWIPFYKETLTEKRLNPEIYSDIQIGDFQIKVAHDIYMNETYLDTIFDKAIHSKMRKEEAINTAI